MELTEVVVRAVGFVAEGLSGGNKKPDKNILHHCHYSSDSYIFIHFNYESVEVLFLSVSIRVYLRLN